MKIKKKVQASEAIEVVAPVESAQDGCKYQGAIDLIKSAIDVLAGIPDDALAKESIANLSVVLLDLKC